MIKLLIDAHVFDGKYQGTRTYIQGIYSAMNAQRYRILFCGTKCIKVEIYIRDC